MDAQQIKDARRSAYKHVREQMKVTQSVVPIQGRWIYYLMEPDRHLVRYVGVAQNPVDRLGCHISRAMDPQHPVERWVADLLSAGSVPRMRLAGRVQQSGMVGGIDHRTGARYIEASLIRRGLKYGEVGGIPADLLNVAVATTFFK